MVVFDADFHETASSVGAPVRLTPRQWGQCPFASESSGAGQVPGHSLGDRFRHNFKLFAAQVDESVMTAARTGMFDA
jgi:hypothetical protein